MATFSPTPAPRPSYKRRARPLGAASSLSRTVNDAASVASMDVDDNASVFSERATFGGHKSETLFAKSDEITVSSYANLPVEVKQILKNAGERHWFSFNPSHFWAVRLLFRRVLGRYRYVDWICGCRFSAYLFCLATCSSCQRHAHVLHLFLSSSR